MTSLVIAGQIVDYKVQALAMNDGVKQRYPFIMRSLYKDKSVIL